MSIIQWRRFANRSSAGCRRAVPAVSLLAHPALLALMLGLFVTQLCWLSAASAQVPPAVSQSAPDTPSKEISVDPKARDGEISARLVRILNASTWFYGVEVNVREGIAFLDGQTDTEARREWAGQLARNTQDVVAVVNRIDVAPQLSWDFAPALREIKRLFVYAQQILPMLFLGMVILLMTWGAAAGVARFARWGFAGRVTSPLLLTFITRALAIPVFLLGLYLVLQIAGLTRLAITVLGGTGILGVILGFAFRDIAENFLASLLLSVRNPFRAGDLIEIGSHRGIVQNLNTRSTVLLTKTAITSRFRTGLYTKASSAILRAILHGEPTSLLESDMTIRSATHRRSLLPH